MTGQGADTRLDCQLEQRAHAIVVSVTGAVDLTTQGIFADAVADALRERATVVIIDLAEVTFMSSPGLAVLVDAHENAMRAHKVVHVAIGTGVVKRSIEVTGLGEILSLVPDVQTALDR
ncbi:STAS domain-containing protein [Actinocrispum sp. NPDC049592]|uniref:STAS domain-containing protein n=1 Tax=Actinocrispum sp. NPDC049592 TaxID=3154835 RepID=UPI0034157DC2